MAVKNPKNKGSQFERDIARRLSKWWMNDNSQDDVFWRTDSSGGRFTQRAKQGKDTVNAAGDISSRCVEGDIFVKNFTVEIKRGYNKLDFLILLDKPSNKNHTFIGWWVKLILECTARNTFPVVIFKRDRSETCVAISEFFFEKMLEHYGYEPRIPYLIFRSGVMDIDNVVLINFEHFLTWLPGPVLREFLKTYENSSSS